MALTKITQGVIKPNENYNTHNINSTGIITATGVTVNGDLNVSGVLTYDDVTNIDSVGIITAQSGIHVTSGSVGIGTDNPATKLDVQGDITIRNGAELNAIRTTSDGKLQFLRNGAVNNQVSVTIDDANGNIGIGTDSPTGRLEFGPKNTLQEIKYGDGTKSGYFKSTTDVNRNNSEQGIHIFDFKWNGTSVSKIIALTGDDTTNKDNGSLTFETSTGAGTVERLRIDSNGRVSINNNSRSASDANEGAQLRVTGTPITRNQYYSPAGDYYGSFGYTDNTYTKSWIAVDSSYNQASAVSSGIFLSAFHSDANGSACGHTIKNERTDAGGLIFSSVYAASSTGNPAVETERLRVTSSGDVLIGGQTAYTYDDTGDSNTILDVWNSGNNKRGILSLSGNTNGESSIGTIWFNNDNNAGTGPGNSMKLSAVIQSQAVTTDSNAGSDAGARLQFMTKPEGGAVVERLRITSDGNVEAQGDNGGFVAPSRRTISSTLRYGTGIQYRDDSNNLRPILHIQAYSRGVGTGTRGSGSVFVNGVEVRNTGRSWGLTVISGSGSNIGEVLHSQTYDVYVGGTSTATSMVNDMATYDTNNNILIANTYDEPNANGNSIRTALKEYYYAKHAESTSHRYAYVHAWRNGYGQLGECHSATRNGSTFTNQGDNSKANAGISFTVIL